MLRLSRASLNRTKGFSKAGPQGPGTGFVEDKFSTDQGRRVVWGGFEHITFILHFISISWQSQDVPP